MTPLALLISLATAIDPNLRDGSAESLVEQNSDTISEDEATCFPVGSLVRLGDGSTKKIEDLGTGDILETSTNLKDISNDDPWVFDWHGHLGKWQSTVKATFLEVAHEAGSVRITGNHLLFARKPKDSRAAVLLAEQLAVGDELLLRDDSQLRPSKVTNITEVQAAGMYAPVTSSGRLVVNDVLVSSYAVPADLPSWSTVLQQVTTSEGRAFVETAVHRALTPLRMRYQLGKVASTASSNVRNLLTRDARKGLSAVDAVLAGLLARSHVDL
jgi:hypothetical protein